MSQAIFLGYKMALSHKHVASLSQCHIYSDLEQGLCCQKSSTQHSLNPLISFRVLTNAIALVNVCLHGKIPSAVDVTLTILENSNQLFP
jgi:hypothetical protein